MALAVSQAVGTAVFAATASFAVASAAATVAFYAVVAAPFVLSAVMADRQRRALANARGLVGDANALQQPIREPAPQHVLALGYATWSGADFFIRGGEENRPYFYLGRLLAAHECDGLESVIVNGQVVLIDPVTGEATGTPFNDGVTVFLQVSFRAGTLDQAIDPILAADFPSLPSTYRQRGQATAVVKAHYGTGANTDEKDEKHKALYGDGEFNPVFRVRGSKVFNPLDPTQSLDDPATWKWSRNAALNAAHYLCWKYRDMRSRIDWNDRMKTAAEICDRYRISQAGENFRQFTLDGAIFSTDPVPDAVSDLLSACGGKLIRDAGKYYIWPSQTEAPVGTIHRGNLRGGVQYRNGVPKGQVANTLLPEFFSPERGYKPVPGPVISDAAAIAEDGETRERSERYPFTETSPRAQRLAWVEFREGRQQETATLGCDLSGLDWQAGRVVTLDLAHILPELTGTWRILSKAWSDGLQGFTLQLRKYDPADGPDAFDPATDEQTFEVEEITA